MKISCLRLGEMRGVRGGLGQGFAVQHDLGTPCGGAGDLGRRGVTRHHDGGGDAQQLRVPRHRLGVVAGRHRDHAARALGRGQQRQAVGRAALLERAGDLQIVELQHDVDAGRTATRRTAARGCAGPGRRSARPPPRHPPGRSSGLRATSSPVQCLPPFMSVYQVAMSHCLGVGGGRAKPAMTLVASGISRPGSLRRQGSDELDPEDLVGAIAARRRHRHRVADRLADQRLGQRRGHRQPAALMSASCTPTIW